MPPDAESRHGWPPATFDRGRVVQADWHVPGVDLRAHERIAKTTDSLRKGRRIDPVSAKGNQAVDSRDIAPRWPPVIAILRSQRHGTAKGLQAGEGGTIWASSRHRVLLTKVRLITGRGGALVASGSVLRCRSRITGLSLMNWTSTFNPQAHRDGTVARPWHGLFYVLSRVTRLIDALPDPRRPRCDATQPATRGYPDCENEIPNLRFANEVFSAISLHCWQFWLPSLPFPHGSLKQVAQIICVRIRGGAQQGLDTKNFLQGFECGAMVIVNVITVRALTPTLG